MADAISIEESNRIRVALGMKPLPVPGQGPTFQEDSSSDSSSEEEEASTLETRQAAGYDNWKELEEERAKKKKNKARIEAIKKERDAAQRFTKLEGKGLGDEDEDEEMSTAQYLKQQKKRQKKIEKKRERARKMEEELKAREQAEYTSKDLAGVKVGHSVGDFEDGEQVLTLKDTTIDENEEEGDELENIGMREEEKLRDKLDLKKKKPAYDPTAWEDAAENGMLSHYDEVIDGKKRKRFELDGKGSTAEQGDVAMQDSGGKTKRQMISLDILKDLPSNDYQEPAEVKMKKPKKKKSKSTRQKVFDEDNSFPEGGNGAENGEAMEVDPGLGGVSRKDINFDDDDEDLQASLARQRKQALKKRKKVKIEDLAREIQKEGSATPGNNEEEEDGGLVLDETSEFIANLQPNEEPAKPSREVKVKKAESESPEPNGADEDTNMDESYANIEDRQERIKKEESEEPKEITESGLDEEKSLSRGLGATLGLLTQRGLIERNERSDLVAHYRDRQKFLVEKQRREEAAELRARQQRERDRASGKLDRMSAREREEYARWENRQRDQAESRAAVEIFNKEYRPDVQLRYLDNHGREMNEKEAFKHLSHQFHGKGSGKQKTEKHLKKIAEEKKREAQSSLDSAQATGMNNALGATAKKNRQAGVRLA